MDTEITTMRLYNPEHVLEKQKVSQTLANARLDLNRQLANDEAAKRSMNELVRDNNKISFIFI